MEEDVLKWLRGLGYDASDAATAKSVAVACKGNLRRVWEFLLSRAKPKPEKEAIDRAVREWQARQEADSAGPSKQEQVRVLKGQLQQLEQQAAALERSVASYQEQVHGQVQDATEEAGEEQMHRQEQQDAQLQTLALKAYHARCMQLVPLLQARAARLQAIATAARGRSDAQLHQQMPAASPYRQQGSAMARRARPPALQERLHQLCSALQQELQHTVDAQCQMAATQQPPSPHLASPHPIRPSSRTGMTESGTSHVIPPDSPGKHLRLTAHSLVADHAASAQLLDKAQRLLQEPPALLLHCMANLAAASGHQMDTLWHEGLSDATNYQRQGQQAGQGQHEEQHQDGAAVVKVAEGSQEAGAPDPEQLVKQRQREHVRLFVECEAARVAAARAQAKLGALLASRSVSALGDAPQLWLAVEGLRSEVAALEALRGELESEVVVREATEAKLQAKWAQIEAMVLQERAASRLLWQLADEGGTLFRRLGTCCSEAGTLLGQQLAPAGDALAAAADAACGAVAREADAFMLVPPNALVPLPAGGHADSAPPTLHRFQRTLQALSEAGRPSTVARGRGAGAGGGAQDGALVAVLGAACEVDAVAPLRCPAAAMADLAGQQQRAAQLHAQLCAFDALLADASDSAAATSCAAAQLATRVQAARDEDFGRVLPALEGAMFRGQEARAFAEGPVKRALQDWWAQPAQHLAPWHKHEGKDCSEWLVEVQALHGRLREMHAQ